MTSRKVLILIVLFVVFDAANSIFVKIGDVFYRFSVFYRAFLEVCLILYFLKQRSFRKIYALFFALFLSFSIGLFFFSQSEKGVDLIESFIIVNKYLFLLPLSMLFIYSYENYGEIFVEGLKKFVDFFFVTNNALIILGAIFGIRLLSSYSSESVETIRWGYKGIIPAQNEASGVYFFGLLYYFRSYFAFEERKSLLLMVATCIAALLTGTKGAIIATLVLGTYYLYRYRRKRLFWVYVPIGTLMFFFVVVQLWDILQAGILAFFVYGWNNNSWITFALTGRDIKIAEAFANVWQHWMVINYIFGGTDLSIVDTETDIIDGFLLLGLMFVLFLNYYRKLFFWLDHSSDNIVAFLLFFLLAATAGHLIYSAIVPTYMLAYVFTYATKLQVHAIPQSANNGS